MFTLNCKGRLITIDKPVVMGILNITPDSFYSGSRNVLIESALKTTSQMLKDGAFIIDIGGQSTRPGSTLLTAEEEMERIVPVIEKLVQQHADIIISVDTFYADVAKAAVEAGALMINDISCGQLDEKMFTTVASLNVPYVGMHMKGTPQTMQQLAQYENVTVDVMDYFIRLIPQMQQAGIKDIILDPGFGFAKTIEHNFQLLKEMNQLEILEKPLLAGLSRKSTVYKTLNTTPEHALNGTTVLNTIALMNGADILRVHDVKEATECIRLFKAMY